MLGLIYVASFFGMKFVALDKTQYPAVKVSKPKSMSQTLTKRDHVIFERHLILYQYFEH